MEATLIYILKWAFCLAVLYIPFTLLLRRESFASLNRRLLLCTVVVSGILPAIVVRYKVEIPTAPAIYEEQQQIAETLHNTILATTPANRYDIFTPKNAAILYFAGFAAALLWGAIGIAGTIGRIKRGTLWTDKQQGMTIHCHAGDTAAFSWFRHVVISENDYNECGTEILLHEKGHIYHKHSYDMLFIGIVKALQWFNPLIYMLENDIRELHEYEADRYVLQNHNDTKAYQLLILRKSLGNKAISLVNNFGTSSVRKRIMMMARKTESGTLQRAKWAYTVPMVSLLILFFAEPRYIYTTPARRVIATATPVATTQIEKATTYQEPQKTTYSQPVTTKTPKQAVSEETPAQEATPESTPETPAAAATDANNEVTQYAYETYYEYRELAEALAGNDCGVKKCSVKMEFTADKNGKASNITAKGCNISMSITDGNDSTIEEIQATIIAATTRYIESREWTPATVDGEAINTNYDAHIIFHRERHADIAANSAKRPLLIGSTPIY